MNITNNFYIDLTKLCPLHEEFLYEFRNDHSILDINRAAKLNVIYNQNLSDRIKKIALSICTIALHCLKNLALIVLFSSATIGIMLLLATPPGITVGAVSTATIIFHTTIYSSWFFSLVLFTIIENQPVLFDPYETSFLSIKDAFSYVKKEQLDEAIKKIKISEEDITKLDASIERARKVFETSKNLYNAPHQCWDRSSCFYQYEDDRELHFLLADAHLSELRAFRECIKKIEVKSS